MLNEWCEGGLGQQKDDGEDCATMCERYEGVESFGEYVDDSVSHGNFCML